MVFVGIYLLTSNNIYDMLAIRIRRCLWEGHLRENDSMR